MYRCYNTLFSCELAFSTERKEPNQCFLHPSSKLLPRYILVRLIYSSTSINSATSLMLQNLKSRHYCLKQVDARVCYVKHKSFKCAFLIPQFALHCSVFQWV